MKVNKSSWHYRLLIDKDQETSCGLIFQYVFTYLTYVFGASMLANGTYLWMLRIISGPLELEFNMFDALSVGAVGILFFGVLAMLVACVIVYILVPVVTYLYGHLRNFMPDLRVAEKCKQLLEKYCSKVEYIDD